MKEITRKSIVIGLIAGILVLLDGIITKILNQNASFTWVAFVSWTVFFGATKSERLKAVLGYIIGFIAAVLIMKLGNILNVIPFNILGVAIGSIIATIVINFACIELESIEKYFPLSISGIFVGIAMTFSGLGIGLSPDSIKNSGLILLIIVLYGVLGLLSGWATLKFQSKRIKK